MLKVTVNQASSIFAFASWVVYLFNCGIALFAMYWWPFQPKQCRSYFLPHHENERQLSVNNF
jgi:lipoprotein signal peptidase